MTQRVTKIFVFYVSVTFIVLSCGCATLSSSKDEEDVLRDRVVRMMDAKIAGNWSLVYNFYAPASRPKTSTGGESIPARGIIFKDYVIKNMEILESGKEARVEISNDISMSGFDFKDAPEVQHWVKVKGKWYLGVKAASPMKTE
jgi:hypothetical protein